MTCQLINYDILDDKYVPSDECLIFCIHFWRRWLQRALLKRILVVIDNYFSHISYAKIDWGHSAGDKEVFPLQRRAVRLTAELPYRSDCRHTLPSIFLRTSNT